MTDCHLKQGQTLFFFSLRVHANMQGATVENVIMHMVIMHISENASGPGGNGARPVHLWAKVHNA